MRPLLSNYIKKIVEYDLLNKFSYSSIGEIPILHKIVLCFEYKNPSYKQILNSLLVLSLISNRTNISLLTLKNSNVSLKLRSGSPVGCKITLKGINMLEFLSTLFLVLLPQDKKFKGVKTKFNLKDAVSLNFRSLFLFDELKSNYALVRDLSSLSIVIVTSANNFSEIVFLLQSLKLRFIP